jgi:hypothetical protein
MSGYPYKPDKTVKVEGWVIRFYTVEHIATCHPRDRNVTFVITDTTEQFNSLPNNVLRELEREGFLDKWRETQKQKSIDRIKEVVANYQNAQKNR